MIVVTGANGRLGSALVERLSRHGPVRAVARKVLINVPVGIEQLALGLRPDTDWSAALVGVDTVVHIAGLTWLPPSKDEQAFDIVNHLATASLARQAACAGVRRLVFVSSLTVNGKHSGTIPFGPDDIPAPGSAYSRSKHAAEKALLGIMDDTGLEIVILRPPRILWPTQGGHLATLASLIRRGVPLPFGSLTFNLRDNITAPNMLSAMEAAVNATGAAGRVLTISDQNPLSTVDLLKLLGAVVGRSPRLFPVAAPLLRVGTALMPNKLLGKLDAQAMFEELTRDLLVDATLARQLLRWTPDVSPSALWGRNPI